MSLHSRRWLLGSGGSFFTASSRGWNYCGGLLGSAAGHSERHSDLRDLGPSVSAIGRIIGHGQRVIDRSGPVWVCNLYVLIGKASTNGLW